MKIKIEVDIQDLIDQAIENEITLPQQIMNSVQYQVTQHIVSRIDTNKIANKWQDAFHVEMDERVKKLAEFPEVYANNQAAAAFHKHLGNMIRPEIVRMVVKDLANNPDFIREIANTVLSKK